MKIITTVDMVGLWVIYFLDAYTKPQEQKKEKEIM